MEVDSVLTANNIALLLAAAVRGVGLAYIPEMIAAPHLSDGSLLRLLDGWCGPLPGFHLYYSSRRHMPPAMRAFVGHMRLSNA